MNEDTNFQRELHADAIERLIYIRQYAGPEVLLPLAFKYKCSANGK